MVITVKNVSKEFVRGQHKFFAVKDVSFDIEKGELVAIMGPSGSGKSTLFHLITGILKPTTGSIKILDKEIEKLDETKLSYLRGSDLGYIMQGQNLLQNLTVMENILLPISLSKNKKANFAKIEELMKLLGINEMAKEYPANLSGGEQRRVSIARTFAQEPKVVIADEPTNSLDTENAQIIMKYFKETAKKGITILVSTHDKEFVNYVDRCLWIEKGILTKGDVV